MEWIKQDSSKGQCPMCRQSESLSTLEPPGTPALKTGDLRIRMGADGGRTTTGAARGWAAVAGGSDGRGLKPRDAWLLVDSDDGVSSGLRRVNFLGPSMASVRGVGLLIRAKHPSIRWVFFALHAGKEMRYT